VASGTFDFAGSGDLVIDQTGGTFGASISGFVNPSQILDFADISSAGATLSYANSGTSGTLTVSNGGNSVSVNLIGSYTSGNFAFGNDGNGGLEVYDPPVVSNGGTTSSGPNTSAPASGGNITASGDFSFDPPALVANGGISSTVLGGPGGNDFNPALLIQFAAALPDGKHFGAFTSAAADSDALAAFSSAFAQPLTHHK
jgi:hypothetical protein